MIHTIPNPQMTPHEVCKFRARFARCLSKEIPPEEKAKVRSRRERMRHTYDDILKNNGGKNPILGY